MKYTRIVSLCLCLPFGLAGDVVAADLLHREGQYIRLTTDIDSAEQAEDLVAAFDAATPQWAKFWKQDDKSIDGWLVAYQGPRTG